MPYSSNISDLEWSVLEPLFLLLLPATNPSFKMGVQSDFKWNILSVKERL